ncbi:MAG: hypothetical protein PHI98_10550 [Eubacteriales bacterium]|nr:hypothetical protein [Eubacteriales bacterium]
MGRLKRELLVLILLLLLPLFCSCKQNPTEEQLYAKLLKAFEDAGYSCVLEELPSDAPVGIYNATVWKRLRVGQEEVQVYFDESNRADYLLTFVDEDVYGYTTCFGQRFVLVYHGTDEALLAFLKQL